MYNPTTRLLTLLELLQMAPQVPGPELAAQLGVDVRTVRHYVMILQDAGIPIVSTTGRTGGYALRPGFKLPPLMFSDDEASAVTLGLLLVQHAGLAGTTVAATTALGKVERVLPTVLRERVQALQSVLVLDLSSTEMKVHRDVLSVLTMAAQHCQQVQLRYTTRELVSERVLDPYSVVYHRARWYVVGYCHLRQTIRSFRLDRIVQALLLESTFVRPAHFNRRTQLLEAFGSNPDVWHVDVTLTMHMDEVRQRVPAALARLEDQGTGVRFRASITDLDWMARFLISLGCPFIIHAPRALRDALHSLATDLLKIARTDTR
jgi:predicted DNA-binding transcriptional regulator YafY